MSEQKRCRTCGSKLIQRKTQKKPSQLKQPYYYTAYYFCPYCHKIYHDDKFKVTNVVSHPELVEGSRSLFEEDSSVTPQNDRNKYDIEIWTDGACVFNGQHNARAAWAFVAGVIEKAGLVPGTKQTNNVAEGLAIFHALDWAAKNQYQKVKIYSDSQITINNIKKPSNQIKQNIEIFQKIEALIKHYNLKVYFEKVIGHSGDVNNTRADKLANQLAGNKN